MTKRPVAATAIVALLAAAATTIVALRYGSRVAGGSDSYGYVSQAQLWREHSFLVSDPIFAASPWPFALETWTPLGYAPGPHRDGHKGGDQYRDCCETACHRSVTILI